LVGEEGATGAAVEQELVVSLAWLIRLRWLAGVGLLLGAAVLALAMDRLAPAASIALLGAGLLAYNLALALILQRLRARSTPIVTYQWFARAQIALDWLATALLAYLTGGLISPVLFFFLFHIVIAALLLPHDRGFLYVTLAPLLVGGTALLQAAHLIPPSPLGGGPAGMGGRYRAAVWLTFTLTCYALAYLSMAISRRLRQREEQLAELNAHRAHFVRVFTHELRSPANVVASLLSVLDKGYAGPLNERQADLVRRALRRTEFLKTLIDDLLALAAAKTATAVEEEQQHISLTAAFDRVAERFRPKAEAKGLALHVGRPEQELTIRGRADEVDRILDNLVGNAVKYTPAGEVRLRLERDGPQARITVSDTGIGIPAESLPHLFREFYRAPNAKELEESGTGLGLSIVHDLVTRYGGKIEVDSEEGQGTTFTVTLPLAES